MEEQSIKEKRVKKITHLYYSRKDIQKAIFDFSENKEISPRYFDGFGKRPDTFQYVGDIFELVKKGATSFHCSEEIWDDPLKLSTEMNPKQLNSLRVGWDLLIDIDSKYLDYSKIMAEIIIKVLKFYSVKNFGIKFSGSKGFHIIVPWKAFPKEINNVKTAEMFPEWPRIVLKFIKEITKEEVTKKINELSYEGSVSNNLKKYIKREGGFDDVAGGVGENKKKIDGDGSIIEIRDNKTLSRKFEDIRTKTESWNKEVMPDLILVSPRHLFRMPYSLHEKTSLASVVLKQEEIKDFQPKDADPLKAKPRNFMPNPEEGEATELLREALDWNKNQNPEDESQNEGKKYSDFTPVKLSDFSEETFPPSIKKILLGVKDGRKRALFVLINLFRSVGMEKDELEKRVYDWNEKNEVPIKTGYIKSQLSWSYRNKVMPPPNYDKEHYKGAGATPTEEELRYKNPANYMVKKSFQKQAENSRKKTKKEKR